MRQWNLEIFVQACEFDKNFNFFPRAVSLSRMPYECHASPMRIVIRNTRLWREFHAILCDFGKTPLSIPCVLCTCHTTPTRSIRMPHDSRKTSARFTRFAYKEANQREFHANRDVQDKVNDFRAADTYIHAFYRIVSGSNGSLVEFALHRMGVVWYSDESYLTRMAF